MSSHFNYEIDEHNMRVKLRDMDLPYKEEAWIQFEAFCDGHKNTYKTTTLPKFNLNLNRSVVLPVVFGGGIILFSMLLFNFVSIKNIKPAENKVVKNTPPKVDQPVQKIVTAPIVKDTTQVLVVQKKDTAQLVAAVIPPTTSTVALPATTLAATAPTVQNNATLPSWTVIEAGDIHEMPNVASKVVGNTTKNITYTALEETNYFIKVSFGQNNQTGYFRKAFLQKNGGMNAYSSGTYPKKIRKAEVLESLTTPPVLPTGSEEKEPELK